MDNRDLYAERTVVGTWTRREVVARECLGRLIAAGSKPASGKRDDVAKWVEGKAEMAVMLADALFDFLDTPTTGVTAQERREARKNEPS